MQSPTHPPLCRILKWIFISFLHSHFSSYKGLQYIMKCLKFRLFMGFIRNKKGMWWFFFKNYIYIGEQHNSINYCELRSSFLVVSAALKLYSKYKTDTDTNQALWARALPHDVPARRETVCCSVCVQIFGRKLQSKWFVNCGFVKWLNEFVHLVLIGL